MDYFENSIDKFKILGVKTWLRCVDYTFVFLNKKEDAERVIAHLNFQEPNFKITCE